MAVLVQDDTRDKRLWYYGNNTLELWEVKAGLQSRLLSQIDQAQILISTLNLLLKLKLIKISLLSALGEDELSGYSAFPSAYLKSQTHSARE